MIIHVQFGVVLGATSVHYINNIITMKKKIIETFERKKLQLEEVLKLQDEYFNGNTKYTLKELEKNEIEIKAQMSILRHLLAK